MAGRLVFQRYASGMSTRSLLGPNVSAASRAGALLKGRTTNLSNVLHGAALHPGMALPNNYGFCANEGGVRILCNLFHKSAVRPGMSVPKDLGIHDHAATFPCSHAAAEISWPTAGLQSIIKNRMKSASVGSVWGSKRTLSSTASNKHEPSGEAKKAARQGQAKSERPVNGHDVSKSSRFCVLSTMFVFYSWIFVFHEE